MAEMARDLPAIEGKPTRPGDERMQAHAMTQKPPDPSAMYRWKEKMKPEDVAEFDAAAGDLLSELGYEVGTADATAERLGGDEQPRERRRRQVHPRSTAELHDYVVAHGSREDEALARSASRPPSSATSRSCRSPPTRAR